MSTSPSTIDYILDQTQPAGKMTSRKMFGEYALYCDDKVVAFVCDDKLYVKITGPGKKFAGKHYKEGHAYPGSKMYLYVDEELIDDREWLSGLIKITADNTALKVKKKKPKSRL